MDAADGADLGPCPICGRPMVEGPSLDRHHWIPRTRGGRDQDTVHRVCHKMVHRLFGEAELAAAYADPEALRAHPEMARFIKWVRRKPPEYLGRAARPRGRSRSSGRR